MKLFSLHQLVVLSDQALVDSIELHFRMCQDKQRAITDANGVLTEMLAEKRFRERARDDEAKSDDQSFTPEVVAPKR